MEQTERTKTKLDENTALLVSDLQKIFGKFDKDTLETVQYMIYCSLSWMADDVLAQAEIKQGNIDAQSSH
jgi:hypothetical protein